MVWARRFRRVLREVAGRIHFYISDGFSTGGQGCLRSRNACSSQTAARWVWQSDWTILVNRRQFTILGRRDCRVASLLAIHTRERTMINETAPVGRGYVPAVRVSGRQLAETSLYAVGSSCTGGDMSPPYKGFHGNDIKQQNGGLLLGKPPFLCTQMLEIPLLSHF